MKSVVLSATTLLVATSACWAADWTRQIDRLAKPYIDSETVVGMTIGVVKGDQTVVRGYGSLSAEDSRKPDGRTIYEIGSVTKVFTGLLLSDAVVTGRVSLVTPAEDLLPEGVKLVRRDDALPIRLWHLSTHTSGLPRLPDNLDPADPNNPYADYDGRLLAEFLNEHKPRKKPGEKRLYSNLGAGLLGHLLAKDRKTDYESLLIERLCKPLGLEDTRITLVDQQQQRVAPPHFKDGTAGYAWDFDKLAGAGAIRSSADDLLKFCRGCLDPPHDKLGQAIDFAWQVHQQPLADKDLAMGLGWLVARDGETRWHNGQTGGYRAVLFLNRRLQTAVVVLANTATQEVDVLSEQLMRMTGGSTEEPRKFPKLFQVAPDTMKRYEGKYELAPGAVFTVSVEGEKLMVGLTGQDAFRVYPRSDTEWFYKVVDAQLTFKVDESGKCTALELLQGGILQRAKRIE